MDKNLLLDYSLSVIALFLVVMIFLVSSLGYRAGRRRVKSISNTDKLEKTIGTITGAMLALLGFILVISLSMADSRFEARRKLVLDEANAIGTSRLRAMAMSGTHGTEIVNLLNEYVKLRMDFFEAGEDPARLKMIYRKTSEVQNRIWKQAAAIAAVSPTATSAILLSSLNEAFDLATSRRWALEVRVPGYMINLLLVFSILSLGMMGYYFGICGVRHLILSLFLYAAFTIAILLVMDLNRPRSGFIKPEQSPLIWLLEELK